MLEQLEMIIINAKHVVQNMQKLIILHVSLPQVAEQAIMDTQTNNAQSAILDGLIWLKLFVTQKNLVAILERLVMMKIINVKPVR